jgi:hypothetical protein
VEFQTPASRSAEPEFDNEPNNSSGISAISVSPPQPAIFSRTNVDFKPAASIIRRGRKMPLPVPRVVAVEERQFVMDMSMMMITNHMAEASKHGRGKAFQWTEHGMRDVATRLVAATLVVAMVFALLELGSSRQPAEGTVAAQAHVTASTGRHSLR